MRKMKFFTHYIVLAATPPLLVYPQQPFSPATPQTMNWLGDSWYTQEKAEAWVCPITYDEIMVMLEDLESGELEKRCPPGQLQGLNEYLAILAKAGILANDFEQDKALEKDTYDLMYGEGSAFQLTRYLESTSQHVIIPAVLNGYSDYNVIHCSKISHIWKKTKKFVKDHKEEIIVGAIVIVAVVAVTVAVVVAVSGAAANTGSSDPIHSESKKSESKKESPSVAAIKAAVDEHVPSFKEFLAEDKALQQAAGSAGWDEISFGEKAREAGANIAHKALNEVTDLIKVVPQLYQEVKELGSLLLPAGLQLLDSADGLSPIENYENFVVKGHQVIDHIFSTDQAELFTLEARANDPMNHFSIGFLPPPGAILKTFSDTSKFVKAGTVFDRAGYTKAGRSLMKHGYREGSAFPKPLGDPAQVNAHGQRVLESIINHPERVIYERPHPDFGRIIEIVVPDQWGARFTMEGEMIGFLEP
jgi:hypothetical protein